MTGFLWAYARGQTASITCKGVLKLPHPQLRSEGVSGAEASPPPPGDPGYRTSGPYRRWQALTPCCLLVLLPSLCPVVRGFLEPWLFLLPGQHQYPLSSLLSPLALCHSLLGLNNLSKCSAWWPWLSHSCDLFQADGFHR